MGFVSFFHHTTHLLKIKFLINLLFLTALAVEDNLHGICSVWVLLSNS